MTTRPIPSEDLPPDLPPEFGPPEVEFRPTFGQTAVGLLIAGSCTAGIVACALFDARLDVGERLIVGSCGMPGLCYAHWLYALRKWRLWVCPGGVVQRRAYCVDQIAWSDVREAVVERHYFTRHPDNVKLVRSGPGSDVSIKPINCSKWRQAVGAVLQAVSDRHIPVRNVPISSS